MTRLIYTVLRLAVCAQTLAHANNPPEQVIVKTFPIGSVIRTYVDGVWNTSFRFTEEALSEHRRGDFCLENPCTCNFCMCWPCSCNACACDPCCGSVDPCCGRVCAPSPTHKPTDAPVGNQSDVNATIAPTTSASSAAQVSTAIMLIVACALAIAVY